MNDIQYRNRRDARGKFTQQGRFNLAEAVRRPLAARLRLYERMVRQDLTIKIAVHTLTSSVISSLGKVTHPDPEVSAFLQNNVDNFEQLHGKSFKDTVYSMLWTMLWGGFSVTESMWDLKFGSLYLDDLLTYHPITIAIYPNKHGKLTDGEDTQDSYHKSGIYQTAASNYGEESQISTWKAIYMGHEADFGNHYGYSIVAPSYKWSRLKEVVIDITAARLNKLGDRMVFASAPSYPLQEELRINPTTGDEESITSLQLVKEQLDSPEDSGGLLIPQQRPEDKVQFGTHPLADNFGDTFLNHISYLDQESVKHIVPYFLISDYGHQDTTNQERRMEVYYDNVDQYRAALCSALIRKVFTPLVEWNFNRESSKIPATFTRVYSDRPEDRVATMQMVKGLTENGYLNPRNQQDWDMVRQMVRLAERDQDANDLKFIKEMLINPRQKTPRASDVGPGGSGGVGKPTGTSMPNQKARESKPKVLTN